MAAFFLRKKWYRLHIFYAKMNHFRMIRGFDFDDMVSQNQIGLKTFRKFNFSGNNISWFDIYTCTHSYFPRTHQILDEGICNILQF
jgi:hypothetical protein